MRTPCCRGLERYREIRSRAHEWLKRRGREGEGGGWRLKRRRDVLAAALRPVAWLYLYQPEVDWNIFHRCTLPFFLEKISSLSRSLLSSYEKKNPKAFRSDEKKSLRALRRETETQTWRIFFMAKMATVFRSAARGSREFWRYFVHFFSFLSFPIGNESASRFCFSTLKCKLKLGFFVTKCNSFSLNDSVNLQLVCVSA